VNLPTLTQSIWIRILLAAITWVLKNGTFKLYSSDTPVGRRLGGSDVPELPDKYFNLDVRLGGRIIVLGYFQTA
jgi:hypothetical protein